MKKFLIVATVVKTHINTFHIPTLKMMKENGYEVHVASHNDYNNPSDMQIPYCDKFIEIPFERSPIKKNNVIAYKKLKKLIDNGNYEIIHCHTPVGGALTRLAARKARKNGTKVLYTAHGFHFYDGAPVINWVLYYPIERWLSNYTDILIAINSEDYERAKNLKSKRVEYIPGVGINVDEIQGGLSTFYKTRKQLDINKESFVIVSVGELNKNKNHKEVINSLGKLKSKNFNYIICGDGPEKENLVNLSEKLELNDKVKFLGFREDIIKIMQISNVFIFPSFREGLSLSVMEAMACGLPIIASRIRGNIDLVDHDYGGYLFDISNPKKIEDYISILENNKKIREKMGTYNLKKIDNYSIDKVNKRLGKVYSSL